MEAQGTSGSISRHLFPAALTSTAHAKRREFTFSLALLCVAFALIWVLRAHGPLQAWFSTIPFEKPLDFALLLVAVLAALFVHELGHLIGALAFGFHLTGASLGPLQVQERHGQWKFSLDLRRFFTGSVSAIPASMKHWRGAMLIVVAAGPLATLGAAVITAAITPANRPVAILQLAFVQVSFLLFALGLIPNGGFARKRNDAQMFIDLATGNEGAEEMEIYVRLSQHVIGGTRPEDYPATLIDRLAAWHGRVESQLVFAQAIVEWALDSEDIRCADAWDLRALSVSEQCGDRSRNHALASSACIDVLFREDTESAQIKFSNVDFDLLFPKSFEYRARAAHQIALGRFHRAPAEIIRGQYSLPRGIPAGDLERKLFARLHEKVLQPVKFKIASA